VPRFRQKVVTSVNFGPPRWLLDREFDLRFHLRRVSAPRPADFEALLDMARVAAMTDFDHTRPLWDATLIDDLAGGGAAVLCRLNHALTDGVGAVEMASAVLFDDTADFKARTLSEIPAAVTGPSLGIAGALSGAVRTVAHGLLHPVGNVATACATSASIMRTVRPALWSGSPIMTERSSARRVAVLEVPFEALRDAGAMAGGSPNDAFIAGLTQGLCEYRSAHGYPLDELVVMMPINIRTTDDPMSGNRTTLMRFEAPGEPLSPRRLISCIHDRTSKARNEKSLKYTELIAGLLNVAPNGYVGSSLRHVDFVASNVPAFSRPVYLGGAPVAAQYAFSPTLGAALNATLVSYAGTSAIGINIDTAAIPDFEVFFGCLIAGFDTVIASAKRGSVTLRS
jgi:diacylglycerol O-acyltransferase